MIAPTRPYLQRADCHFFKEKSHPNKQPSIRFTTPTSRWRVSRHRTSLPRETDRFQPVAPYIEFIATGFTFGRNIPRAGGWVSSVRNCAPGHFFFPSHAAGECIRGRGRQGVGVQPGGRCRWFCAGRGRGIARHRGIVCSSDWARWSKRMGWDVPFSVRCCGDHVSLPDRRRCLSSDITLSLPSVILYAANDPH